jgi:hypothetical protein
VAGAEDLVPCLKCLHNGGANRARCTDDQIFTGPFLPLALATLQYDF